MASSKSKKLKRYTLFDVINTLLVVGITFMIAYPLYFIIIASFSDPTEVAKGNTLLWIKGFTVEAYKYVFKEEQLWTGYRNTIFYTIFGTLYNLVLTIPAAYVLTKKYLPFRTLISWFFLIMMYFSGGMIPTYLLIKNLGLLNNPLVMIVGAGVSCSNLIVTRQYFATSIHPDIYEAAYIDGASEWQCFVKIAMPLAKPILAVMTLYYGVGHWNNYYSALLYIRDYEYAPLQLVLRRLLYSTSFSIEDFTAADGDTLLYQIQMANMAQSMKYAIIFIASVPLFILYPFVQKHFTTGMMVGSVKG